MDSMSPHDWGVGVENMGRPVNWTINNHSETEEKQSGVLGQVWPSPQVYMALEVTCLVDKGREADRSTAGFP